MARFHFRVDDIFFYLDATTNVNTTYPARLSSSPMQDGTNQSDHYVVDQPTCTFTGVITDIKTSKSVDLKPTGKWIDEVLRLAMRGQSSVFLRNRVDAEETGNWFITRLNPVQDNRNYTVGYQGSEGEVKQAFRITIQFKQALLSQGLISTVEPSQAFSDALQEKGKKNTATQQFGDSGKDLRGSQKSLEQSRKWGRFSARRATDVVSSESE